MLTWAVSLILVKCLLTRHAECMAYRFLPWAGGGLCRKSAWQRAEHCNCAVHSEQSAAGHCSAWRR